MLIYVDTIIGFSVVMLAVSLLVTILNQIISALLNHRGSNLRWGLKTLFANIDPKAFPTINANAERLATAVLEHCLVSDSWFSGNKFATVLGKIPPLGALFARFKLASAIRPGELTAILAYFANNPPADVKVDAQELKNLVAAPNPSAQRDMALATQAAVAAVAAVGGQAATPLLQETVNTVRDAAGNLEAWFTSMMDRVAQKFAMYMRIWTVVFSVLFAGITGLNSIQLAKQLYEDGAFRNALSGAGQQMLASAATVLSAENSPAAIVTAALKQALGEAGVSATPPTVPTAADGVKWIQENVPAAQRQAALDHFNADVMAASQKAIQDGAKNAAAVVKTASQSGFDVFQIRWPAQPGAVDYLGVAITAALLSMGAPFWFNALKTVTNLRPIVANKEKEEQASAK